MNESQLAQPCGVEHLYVHIPFCRSRCLYCDFASEPIEPHTQAGRVLRYMEALRAELGQRARAAPGYRTVYVGGGTPTVLPRESLLALVRDLAALQRGEPPGEWPEGGQNACGASRDACGASRDACGASRDQDWGKVREFTVEANPGTIDAGLLTELAAAGVTRLSVGIQSFSPRLRGILGRKLGQAEIESALAAVKRSGWEDWNLDLIFAIPGQTWEEAAADLAAAVAAQPTHISLYDLTYTPAYVAHVQAILGPEAVASAAEFAEYYYAQAVALLESAGYERYEVSNFARPGYRCWHNLGYWRGEEFLGVGASAVSTVGHQRRTNPRTVTAYLAGEPPEVEQLDRRTRLWEMAMLGLRTTEGVDEQAVLPVLDAGAYKRLMAQGLLEKHCGKLRLNPGFLNVSNAIISELLVYPEP